MGKESNQSESSSLERLSLAESSAFSLKRSQSGRPEDVNGVKDFSLELVLLLQEIVMRVGLPIKTTIQQYYPSKGANASDTFRLKKPPSQRSLNQSEYEFRIHRARIYPAEEIEQFCEEYNAIFQSFRNKDNNSAILNLSAPPFKLHFDKVLAVYSPKENSSASLELTATTVNLQELLIANYKQLYQEISWPLNAASLRHNKLVKITTSAELTHAQIRSRGLTSSTSDITCTGKLQKYAASRTTLRRK